MTITKCAFNLLDLPGFTNSAKGLKSRLKGAKRSVPIIPETLLRYLWIYTDFVGLCDENCIMAYYGVPLQKNFHLCG